MIGTNKSQDYPEFRVKSWSIDNTEVLTFYGTQDNSILDEHNSCLIQAGYKEGTVTVHCDVEYRLNGERHPAVGVPNLTITDLNDQDLRIFAIIVRR
jgi:hypothetical protein